MAIASRVSLLAVLTWLLCITAASPVSLGNKDAPETAADGGEVGAEEMVPAVVRGIAKESVQEEGEDGGGKLESSQIPPGTSKVSVHYPEMVQLNRGGCVFLDTTTL